jgi:tRNA threonylcarbamoyladenosine biosynthesis protein TsaB
MHHPSDPTTAAAPERLVLGLTTSAERGGAALVVRGAVVAEFSYEGGMTHAERIVGAVDAVFAAAGVGTDRVGAIGCDVGPGSFTGVRAGLATAKGIAFGLGLPMVAIGSLEAMAAEAVASAEEAGCTRVAALLDAKRSETFYAVYDLAGSLLQAPSHALTAEIWSALEPWAEGEPVALVGAQGQRIGAPPDGRPSGLRLVENAGALPTAVWVARLAERQWLAGKAVDPGEIEPV